MQVRLCESPVMLPISGATADCRAGAMSSPVRVMTQKPPAGRPLSTGHGAPSHRRPTPAAVCTEVVHPKLEFRRRRGKCSELHQTHPLAATRCAAAATRRAIAAATLQYAMQRGALKHGDAHLLDQGTSAKRCEL